MMTTALRKKNTHAKDKCIKQKYLFFYHLKPKLTSNAVQIITELMK